MLAEGAAQVRELFPEPTFDRIQMSDDAERLQRAARLVGRLARQLARVQPMRLARIGAYLNHFLLNRAGPSPHPISLFSVSISAFLFSELALVRVHQSTPTLRDAIHPASGFFVE